MKYLIQEPYAGSVRSVVNDDGIVAWTDGLTVEEYIAKNPNVRLVEEAELTELTERWVETQRTPPTKETRDQWWNALECLPPCRWRTVRGVEMFHVSERITHDLVSWHAKHGDFYWTLTDRAGADQHDIAEAVKRASVGK